jgi:trans-aconitate 2-methyltransferase
MPTWDANQYLRFSDERTRPCRELAARISIPDPRRVIDLGCGPGNSTAVLAERWPKANLVGLDSSPEMIAAARRAGPGRDWRVGDITSWAQKPGDLFDVVFSNAALQWVGGHGEVFLKLFQHVAPAGALGVQMPGNFDAPAHRIMRELADSIEWRDRFGANKVREWYVHDLPFYYDLLAPAAAALDLWETQYYHNFPDAAAIVEWYKGSGLRPFLEALPGDEWRAEFSRMYLERIRQAYPARADGRVIFPFRRLFLIAYRGDASSQC